MVFTSNDRAAHHSWPNSVIKEIVVSDYSSDSATAEFFDIVRKFKPDRIISSSEEDVLRVAEARSLFGIPGLQYELALRCRDKVTMKQTALLQKLRRHHFGVRPLEDGCSQTSLGRRVRGHYDTTFERRPVCLSHQAGICQKHTFKPVLSRRILFRFRLPCGCSLYQFRFDPDFTVTISCPATRFRETKHRFRNVRRERRRLFRTAPADKATH